MKKNSDKDKKKVLSIDETVELLGANPPVDIGMPLHSIATFTSNWMDALSTRNSARNIFECNSISTSASSISPSTDSICSRISFFEVYGTNT